MKYNLKHILLLAAFACSSVWAEDDNVLYFTETLVMPGETTDIGLCMRNTATDLTCLEVEIQLPEGLSVVCDEEGKPVAKLYDNRTAGHELLANVLNSGNLKLLVSSTDASLFSGEEGPLLNFLVQVAETAPVGACAVETVGESLLVNSNADAYYNVGVKGEVLITDDATGISEVENGKLKVESSIYNLTGQRLNKKQKGINIVGGKKELHR